MLSGWRLDRETEAYPTRMPKKVSAPIQRLSSRSLPAIKTEEYAKRRQRVLTGLKGAVAVVFAGEGSPPLKGHWQPDLNFAYLTGITDEPGAAVTEPRAPARVPGTSR